jgi:hypothetical protein
VGSQNAPAQIRAAKVDADIPDTINRNLALRIVQKAAIVFGGDRELHRRYGEWALLECACYLTFLVYRMLALADGQRAADYVGRALMLSVRDVFVHNSGTAVSSGDIKGIWEVRSRLYRAIKREEMSGREYTEQCLFTLATFMHMTARDGAPCPIDGSEPIGLTLPKVPPEQCGPDLQRMTFALEAWHEEIVDAFVRQLGFIQDIPAEYYADKPPGEQGHNTKGPR